MMDSSWRRHAGEWSGDVIDNARRTEQTALRTSARHIDQTILTCTLFTTDVAIPSPLRWSEGASAAPSEFNVQEVRFARTSGAALRLDPSRRARQVFANDLLT